MNWESFMGIGNVKEQPEIASYDFKIWSSNFTIKPMNLLKRFIAVSKVARLRGR